MSEIFQTLKLLSKVDLNPVKEYLESIQFDYNEFENFFATPKKEKLYQLYTTKITMEEVTTEVWRFVQEYNRIKICTLLMK